VTTKRPLLMLLDGHSLAYRAFYALPAENFSTTSGVTTNAVYGFLSMLINTVRDEQPSHVAVAFDVSRQTFRTAEFPDYKANRSASPPEFKPQVGLIQKFLGELHIPVVTAPGFEADDIIATLARRAHREGFEVLILTGDRDALQLVEPGITVLYPRKGVSDLARMTPDAVEAKYGVTPLQYADLAALRGDPSDNLPGIPGVGEKTAAKWIAQFGSVAEIADRVDEIGGKVGQSLRDNLPSVLLNRKLTALVDDVPLDVELDDAQRREWNRAAVDSMLDELEFRALRDRLWAIAPGASADATQSADRIDDDGVELTAPEVQDWWREHVQGVTVGVHVDGTALHGSGRLDSLAIATPTGAAWIDGASLAHGSTARAAVVAWLNDASAAKVVHGANRTSLILGDLGADAAGIAIDTELSAYVLSPDARGYELDLLTRTYLGRDLPDADAGEGQLSFNSSQDAVRAANGRARARAVLELSETLREKVASVGGGPLLDQLELPVTRVLVRMERTGIAVDVEGLEHLSAHFDGKARAAASEADALAGHPVNLASPKQLQVVLFDEFDMPRSKKTKTGFSTDAETLASLYESTQHPFLAQVLAHRDAAKLRATVDGLLSSVSDDGRIRTTYAQTIAATGRLSSTDPNLQNIPVRTEDGRRIRECFVVGNGFESLLTADYSQIEMRIMAHLSGDAGLIEAFRSGEDLHTTVGARVFGVAPSEVDAEMRRRIKAMSYGLAYGLSAFGLAKQLGISTSDAQGLMDEYFERFGGVRDYLATVVAQARVTGYTETVLGRRRYLPDLTSDNRQRREAAERMELNAPIQGSAADIIKVAMLQVQEALIDAGLSSRLLLQVHDELVLEVAPQEQHVVEDLVRDRMGAAYALDVPLDVSVGIGSSWDAAAH
jgi:DNA polymerase-1